MWTDGKYENSEGSTKVHIRKSKRRNDLVASRGELVEVNFEATFEPVIQGKDLFERRHNPSNRHCIQML